MRRGMLALFNLVWEWEVKPLAWSLNRIKYLYKGKGDRVDFDKYRPVTLISCVGKLMTMLWWVRLEEQLDRKIREVQSGFRKKRGVRDVWWVLEGIIRNLEGKKFVGFVDFSKAFDRVWRDGLWYKLYTKGVAGKMWRMVQLWYEGSAVKAEWREVETEWMEVDVGVRQGCILSGCYCFCG